MGIRLGELFYDLTIKKERFKEDVEDAKGQVKSLEERLTTSGKNLQETGSTLTKSITVPLLAIAGAAVKVSMDFNAQMSRVKAISGATGDEFEALRAQAKELGATTVFSATQAAEGMENLASAGFTASEITAAMPGLLDLAAASGSNLGTASEIAAAAVRAFGLEASDATHVADVFAEVSARTQAQTEDLGDALKYVGPQAKNAGLSLEQTSAAIGIMSDVGIKGSMAGTTLRSVLQSLQAPTEKAAETMAAYGINVRDANGQMKSLPDIIEALQIGLGNLSAKHRDAALSALFGARATSGMLALMDAGPEKIQAMTEGLENSTGAAREMAEIMQENLKGTVVEMKSALEGAGIAIGDSLAPHITKLAEFVTDLARGFQNLEPHVQKNILGLLGLAAGAGPAVKGLGKLIETGGKAVGQFKSFSEGLKEGGTLMSGFKNMSASGKAGLAAVGIGLLTAAVSEFVKQVTPGTEASRAFVEEVENMKEQNKGAADEVEGNAMAADALIDRLEELQAKTELTALEQENQKNIIAELNRLYPDMGFAIDETTGKLNKSTESARRYIEMQKQQAMVKLAMEEQSEAMTKMAEAMRKAEESARELDKFEQLLKEHGFGHLEAGSIWDYQLFGNKYAKLKEEVQQYKQSQEELQKIYDQAVEDQKQYEETISQLIVDGIDFRIDQNGELVEFTRKMTKEEADQRAADLEQYKADLKEKEEVLEQHNEALEEEKRKHLDRIAGIDSDEIKQSKMTMGKWKEQMDSNRKVYDQWLENLTNLKERAGEIPPEMIEDIQQMGPEYSALVAEMANSSSEELGKIVKSWQESQTVAEQAARGTVEAVDQGFEPLPGMIGESFDQAKQTIEAKGAEMSDAGTTAGAETVGKIKSEIESGTGGAVGVSLAMAEKIQNEIKKTPEKSKDAGTDTAGDVEEGIESGTDGAVSTVRSMVTEIQNTVKTASNGSYAAGQAVGDGLRDGINSRRYAVMAAARSIARAASDTINSELDINSPSGVTTYSGEMTGGGFAGGIEDTRPEAIEAAKKTAQAVVRAFDTQGSASIDLRTIASASRSTWRPNIDTGALLTAWRMPQILATPTPTAALADSGRRLATDGRMLGNIVADATRSALNGMAVNIDHRLAGRIQADNRMRAGVILEHGAHL